MGGMQKIDTDYPFSKKTTHGETLENNNSELSVSKLGGISFFSFCDVVISGRILYNVY